MRSLWGVVLLLSVASAAAAKPKHWHDDEKHWSKHSHDQNDDERDEREHHEYCYFEPPDVRIIREYYEPRYRALPPGQAKKFYRTGELPSGWQKRVEPLPVEVERHLVPLRPDYRRGYVDGAVVVYA